MNFSSDNTAGIAPGILEAIARANEGFAPGYGEDDWTRSVERRLSEIFERDVAAFLVPTGTAANALALAQVTPPWGVVLCHADSHIATDECGAAEFFGGGLKLSGLTGEGGKIAPDTLNAALAGYGGHSPHQMMAAALSITQASEAGTVYRTDEIAALCEMAHARTLAVHMDGARFANALVRLNVTPAQMTWRAGVDVLSLGATKAGALAAEAVVFFEPARAAFMAERLAQKLTAIGLAPVWPAEANLVFVVLPRALDARLKAAGASYYVRSSESLKLGADQVLARLVTSFATLQPEIDRFVDLCKNS